MDEYLKMYEGIPFSPVATLTQPVNEADTVIYVSDSGAFPEGPNYATIGSDENAETILYAQKTEESLSGCTRGVEGIARAWQAEEVIARNFTGMDYEALRKNVDKAVLELSGKANSVNGQTPDANGDIKLAAEHVPIEIPDMDAGTVQEAVHILKKDGDKVREYFTLEGAAKNAAALNNIPGENYLPEKITGLTGAKSYEYAAPMASVARPSFAGRTVQEGTPGVDNPAAVKGVLNPWAAAYTGEPVEVAAGVDPLMALPNGTQDRIVLQDGQWGIERKVIALTFDGTQAEVHTNIGQQPAAEDVVCFYCNAYRYLKLAEQLGLSNRFPKPTAWDANEESIWINQYFAPCWKIKKYRLTGWSESLSEPERVALMNVWLAANPTQFYVKLPEPVFEPVPAWNGFGKIEPIAVTTSITKPNPDAPISPDNVATITGTPVVTTGYRGQLRQLTAELFEGDSFDGVNLTTNGTVSRHDMDLPLSPGNYTIEAGDENGLLESVSIQILPDSAVFGRRVYPYRHIKEGTVHKLTGTPGAAQIIFNATDVYQDGDTWTLNGAAVSVTYADGQTLLPTAVIAGDAVQAAVEGGTVRLMLQKPTPQKNLLGNADLRDPTNQRGQPEYVNNGLSMYTIDMWRTVGYGSVALCDGFIKIAGGSSAVYFHQILEKGSQLEGRVLTYTLLLSDGTMHSATGKIEDGFHIVLPTGWCDCSITNGLHMTQISVNAGAFLEVAAIKLEPGPRFTGWHEPKPGQTLAECQRYLLRNSPGNTVEIRASYVYNGGINFIIPIPITMRTSPAISTALENSIIEVRNMSNAAQSGFTFSTVALPGAIKITASKVNHGLSDAFLAIRNVLFTAEL